MKSTDPHSRFRRILPAFLSTLLVVCLAPVPALAGTSDISGQTASGAFYRFVVPDGWQPADGLVIWNHGFDLGAVGPVSDLGPLVDIQLAEGWAVAASSYSLPGWALFGTATDNRQMVEVFESTFGVPDRILITGASLGGIVTAQAIEQGDLGNVVGALTLCGALAGSRVWDGALDLRLLYDAVCGGVSGAAIPGGAGGLPDPPDPNFDEVALLLAVNTCTGVSLPPELRTPEQQARLDQLLAVSQIPESFLLTDMGFATFALHDLVHDPAKLDGGQAMENGGVVYDDPTIDATIERVSANPADRALLTENFSPTGNVGATRMVSLHTDKDGLVIVENQSEYASVVPANRFTVGVVVEATPSHCSFTEGEVLAGWFALQGWVLGAAQPTAGDLQTTCDDLVTTGIATGPCRIDPNFVIPDMDDRIAPRGPLFTDGFESGDTTAWSASVE